MSVILTVRVDESIKKRLEALSESTMRNKTFLANDAIKSYLELNEWQIDAIQKGVKAADNNEFASKHAVRKCFSKWGVKVEN